MSRAWLFACSVACFAAAASTVSLADGPRRQAKLSELRPAHFDWQGAYGGALFSVKSFEAGLSGFGATPDSVDGSGRIVGIVAGYNQLHGDWLLGIEADAGYGQLRGVKRNRRFKADITSTVRTRFGRQFDNTLVYGTAGLLFAGINQSSNTMIKGDTSTQVAAVGGAGIEHAITNSLSGRLEYLYAHGLRQHGVGFRHMHMIRAGAVFHFQH